jgi:hypothetical protein
MRRDKGKHGYRTNKAIKYCSGCTAHTIQIKLAPFNEMENVEGNKCIERKRKTRKVKEEIQENDRVYDEIKELNAKSKKQFREDTERLAPLMKYSITSTAETSIEEAKEKYHQNMKNCIGNPMHKHHYYLFREHRNKQKDSYSMPSKKYLTKAIAASEEEGACGSDSD